MIEDAPRGAACVAKGPVTVVAIKRKAFLNFLKEDDGLEDQMKQRINRYERGDFDRGLLDKSSVGKFGVERITRVLAAAMLVNCMYLSIVLVVLIPDLTKFESAESTSDQRRLGAGFSATWSSAWVVLSLVPAFIMVLLVIPVLVSRLVVLSAIVNIKLDAVEWVCLRHKQVEELHAQVAREMRNHFQRIGFNSNSQLDISAVLESMSFKSMTMHEFEDLLHSMNIYLSRQDLDSMMRRIDRDLASVPLSHQFSNSNFRRDGR